MKAFTNISKSFAGRFKRWGGGEQVGHAFWSSVPEYLITPKIEYIFWALYLHFISPFRVFLKYKNIPTAEHVFDFYISSKNVNSILQKTVQSWSATSEAQLRKFSSGIWSLGVCDFSNLSSIWNHSHWWLDFPQVEEIVNNILLG